MRWIIIERYGAVIVRGSVFIFGAFTEEDIIPISCAYVVVCETAKLSEWLL